LVRAAQANLDRLRVLEQYKRLIAVSEYGIGLGTGKISFGLHDLLIDIRRVNASDPSGRRGAAGDPRPGRAARLAQTCDRATAHSAIGALVHVIRDLS
jgi:hypothetical protein